MPPAAILAVPVWAPQERAAPLKDEYLQFHHNVTRYHDRVEGYLIDDPDLAEGLADVPDALDVFTDKTAIILSVNELLPYLSDVRSLFEEVRRRRAERADRATRAPTTLSGSADHERGGPKIRLPTDFEGSANTARTFLAECNNYIALNRS